ncbi:regulator of chromosome condensation (RCC1) repeat-containing protein [Besnoitia besnoiti]|uniref:Regulator of chromosome condensation (RCC1) repeat-containing protein n=1 Tax=Besnoitia besnoiti TaxID=94643 RepID=A0A2A9MFZ5_BESBE|nr:regulator of chromosome condensation (RCC1) repeat-containing protein [Besnoitia besnoiti]PFH34302.1 regulator of chromosome condensation (RCC1) repeat-containing protein [Besnoitia besnoiti]
MRRLNPFAKQRYREEEKPVTEEFTAVLSTDSLVKDIPYRDTRTLIFVYGKPLISNAEGSVSLPEASPDGEGAHGPDAAAWDRDGRAAFSGIQSGASHALHMMSHPTSFHFAAGRLSGGVGGLGDRVGGPSPYYEPGAPPGAALPPSMFLSPPTGGGGEGALLQPLVLSSLAYVRVVDACVGERHALFLSDAGEVYAYGEGRFGQLGLGYELQVIPKPQKIEGALGRVEVQQIACGDYHSVVLSREGAVYAWGAADCVGDGSGLCRYAPVGISLPASSEFAGPSESCHVIAARFQQTMAVTEGGHLFVWGETFFANFHPTPEILCIFPKLVVQIAIGKHFGLALTDDGLVYGWGDGTYGELTTACSTTPLTLPQPLQLKDSSGQSLPPIIAVAAGLRHAIVLTHDMRLWAFGDNLAGQCGVPGHQTRLSVPKIIKLGELRSRASKIACGYRHSACITPNYQLYLWGHSSNHKLIFTAAAEGICDKATQPGVAIRSGLKSSCCRARLIYSMLNMKIMGAALGSETTIIVTGDGDFEHTVCPMRDGGDLPAAPNIANEKAFSSEEKRDAADGLQARVITAADLTTSSRPLAEATPRPSAARRSRRPADASRGKETHQSFSFLGAQPRRAGEAGENGRAQGDAHAEGGHSAPPQSNGDALAAPPRESRVGEGRGGTVVGEEARREEEGSESGAEESQRSPSVPSAPARSEPAERAGDHPPLEEGGDAEGKQSLLPSLLMSPSEPVPHAAPPSASAATADGEEKENDVAEANPAAADRPDEELR